MQVVHGIGRLTTRQGPVFVVVGVFDGLHLGHHYLLEQLVKGAVARAARPTVVTFDHHPDEVLTGQAPPLLLDPIERLERLAAAGVGITIVQPFDEALRQTPYDEFVARLRAGVELRGILMTPDAAFGYERRGTPDALAALGTRDGFDVLVVPPFSLDGRAVRSSEIRALIRSGGLGEAAELLGRPFSLTGAASGTSLTFELPMALPPDGSYRVRLGGVETTVEIRDGDVRLPSAMVVERVTLEFLGT